MHGNFAKDGWRYREAYFTDFDGKHYQLTLSVAYGKNGKVAYNIANMKERSFPQIHGSSNPKTGAQGGKASSDGTVPQKEPNVKQSRRDTKGNELSQKQQEFFKDSKVRDKRGNLKVMYHGTPNGTFTVFNDGTYFTENKEYADLYQNTGASMLSVKKTANAPKALKIKAFRAKQHFDKIKMLGG